MKKEGFLLLEDGSIYEGGMFGFEGEAYGEVVFSTCMTGYEESLSDPSYRGQILVFTYPLIGNYSFKYRDMQAATPHIRAVVVSENTSSYGRNVSSLERLLKNNRIPGLEGVDTRSIVIRIRESGTMKGIIMPGNISQYAVGDLLDSLKHRKNVWEENLVSEVSTSKRKGPFGKGSTVAILDFGAKRNLLNDVSSLFSAYLFPYSSTYEQIMAVEPEGIVISSGPGDPAHPELKRTLPVIRRLCEEMPVLGVCLGHQMVSLAFGGSTYKLRYGHRGINHPVRIGERVYITSQNHGFSVSEDSLADTQLRVNQRSLNDQTVEGLTHETGNVITTQYHPEAGPGPSDTRFVYDHFKKLVQGRN